MKTIHQAYFLKGLILALFFFIYSSSIAQQTRWMKEYDLSSRNLVIDISSVDDGYVSIGETYSNQTITGNFLLKTDLGGEVEWTLPINLPNLPPVRVHSFLKTVNGYVVLAEEYVNSGESLVMYTFFINEIGEVQWLNEYDYPNSTFMHVKNIIANADGTFTFSNLVHYEELISGETVYDYRLAIHKIDNSGNDIWEVNYDTYGHYEGEIIPTSDGGFIFYDGDSGFLGLVSQTYDLIINKIDENGQLVWSNIIEIPNVNLWTSMRIRKTIDDGILIAHSQLENNIASMALLKISNLGELEWDVDLYAEPGETAVYPESITDIKELSDGSIAVVGLDWSRDYTHVSKLSSSGITLWTTIIENFKSFSTKIIETADGGLLINGMRDDAFSTQEEKTILIKMDGDGNYLPKILSGNVFRDNNDNCQIDNVDSTYSSAILEVVGNGSSYYMTTDSDGYFEANLDTGEYQIFIHPNSPYVESCSASYPASLQNLEIFDTTSIDIPVEILIDCPYLEVDVSTFALRDCFDNKYDVCYRNLGTATALDAFVELTIPYPLSFQSSNIPYTGPDGNDTYTFQLGDLNPSEKGSFHIIATLPCDTLPSGIGLLTGNTYCMDAHIFPDSLCTPISSLWDGSSIQVTGECTGDSILFRIKNIGIGNMNSIRNYYVIEDEIMVNPGTFQLLSGEETTFSVYANGSTFRLEAEQDPEHPGINNPSIALEGCGEVSELTQGFINQFAQNDADPFISTECREVTSSYDPNDKQGFPKGKNEEHYINKNTDIEYLIRFQNMGNDTAFNVVIKDPISADLDMATIRTGSSSHDYNYSIQGRTIIFHFNDIMLVDSETNEVGSYGFVKFRISQIPDLAEGTVIENHARIYFDFNPAIITNTSYHTIAENVFHVNIEDIPQTQNLSIKAYPNPFIDIINFELKGDELLDDIQLSVFDVSGRMVRQEKYDSSTFQFHKGNLNSGIYFYTIEHENIRIASGKIILK